MGVPKLIHPSLLLSILFMNDFYFKLTAVYFLLPSNELKIFKSIDSSQNNLDLDNHTIAVLARCNDKRVPLNSDVSINHVQSLENS